MKTTKPSVLIYGHDPTLLETRSWVLARNGFDVGTASHLAEAERTLSAQIVDLFLICHTIPSSERRSAVATLKAIRPQSKIVLVTTANNPEPEGAWQTVDALAGTEAMILAARRALEPRIS
jgi:DNA-binding response OmpR family regulator